MELIAHEDFGKLRLHQFLKRGIRKVENWEFMDDIWVGEVVRATAVLQLERDPEVTRAVEVDLGALSEKVRSAMLGAIGLPLEQGMSLKQLAALLGKPVKSYGFFPDRKHHDFKVGMRCRYTVSCIVLAKGGLIDATVLAPRPRSR